MNLKHTPDKHITCGHHTGSLRGARDLVVSQTGGLYAGRLPLDATPRHRGLVPLMVELLPLTYPLSSLSPSLSALLCHSVKDASSLLVVLVSTHGYLLDRSRQRAGLNRLDDTDDSKATPLGGQWIKILPM